MGTLVILTSFLEYQLDYGMFTLILSIDSHQVDENQYLYVQKKVTGGN